MRAFEDISIDYKVINQKAYPKIKIEGLVKLPDFNSLPPRSDGFYLRKYRIPRSDTEMVALMSRAVFYQTIMYYMDETTYMSAYIYMNDWADFGIGEILNVSDFFVNSQYNIIDMETDLDNELYIYRVFGYYDNVEYASSYVAGIMHFNIKSEDLDNVEPEEVGGLVPINMGLGNIFCSDDIYTIDKEQRIYIKGLPTNTLTYRYKGPIDHTVEKASRESIIGGLEFMEHIYDGLYGNFSDIIERTGVITTELTSSYRRTQ